MKGVLVTLEQDLRMMSSLEGTQGSIMCDFPKVYGGKGEVMTPTDLFSSALGSCMLGMMASEAKKCGADVTGARCFVEKKMVFSPVMRIAHLIVVIEIPLALDEETRRKLENAAMMCPIHKSLHPEIQQEVTFRWGVSS